MILNKADGVGIKVSNKKEIVFIEIAGGPEITSTIANHAKEDTEKLIKEAMFGLVSLLRGYLNKNAEDVTNICIYTVQVIGDQMTLNELRLNKKHSYIVSQIKSATIPFSFDEIGKFLESKLEDQINALKKLMVSNSTEGISTVRDWIWVPNSNTEWEMIIYMKTFNLFHFRIR
ncbi:hypothetical protein Glove_1g6 [Diversispora epigaea]|uniref:Uncharacterized protein n=1 Tax=Diversispora epigaea TaxID=1348612 RepID=A0A397JPL6_9GLOM|nr:hypothetical protein Glove_1g6 [Diversispora epigaea]